jgi:hypothetical protein
VIPTARMEKGKLKIKGHMINDLKCSHTKHNPVYEQALTFYNKIDIVADVSITPPVTPIYR